MTQFDEEFSKRAEELRRLGVEFSRELRKLAADFQGQTHIFVEDFRKRGHGAADFEQSAIEKIRALAKLREDGIITEEDFQEQKKRLLDQV